MRNFPSNDDEMHFSFLLETAAKCTTITTTSFFVATNAKTLLLLAGEPWRNGTKICAKMIDTEVPAT